MSIQEVKSLKEVKNIYALTKQQARKLRQMLDYDEYDLITEDRNALWGFDL